MLNWWKALNNIKVLLVNADDVGLYTQLACTITRAANKYDDPQALLDDVQGRPWSMSKVNEILHLPHGKVSRITDFVFLVMGTSRRFLAQLTTHHVGITTISGSLQYSDHSKRHLSDMFVVPYNMLATNDKSDIDNYLEEQYHCFNQYLEMIQQGYTNDDAGYTMPQSLRNALLIKVNLEELKFIGNQRLCKRNTDETRYVFAKMIQEVCKQVDIDDDLFMPSCHHEKCKEGQYCCGKPFKGTIDEYLEQEFPCLK